MSIINKLEEAYMCGFVFTRDKKVKKELIESSLNSLKHRGPDDIVLLADKAFMGFSRLSIIDESAAGRQPFQHKSLSLLCNGEIFNYKKLKERYEFDYKSKSDCEVLLPMFEQKTSIKKFLDELDGEFAFVIYDKESSDVFAARDPMGIRPLFYGETESGEHAFASEIKGLQGFCHNIQPLPPGHYYWQGEIKLYHDLSQVKKFHSDSQEDIYKNINKLLVSAVKKRLQADAPIGFLLSGGLDSSLVCAIAAKHSDKPIKTFAVGMSGDAIDLKYAKEVALHIGSDHTEVIMEKEDVLGAIQDVVYHLESFDITTVRASVGMYLICKYIKEKTDIKVLLTGEVSDEIFGYKYTDFAPSAKDFQLEAAKRVKELYVYDVLRADRCIAANSLEARVPFGDKEFVEYVMSIDPKKKMNTYGQGKYILRKAFEGDYLPKSILYREKAAFSDAVGHSMVDYIKEYAESLYTERDLEQSRFKYKHCAPFTKESLLFRDIFERFYSEQSKHIPSFWMPNKEWENCDVADPSARVLPNYGASGL